MSFGIIFVLSLPLASSSRRCWQYSRSDWERFLTSRGVLGRTQREKSAKTIVKTPSSRKIHCKWLVKIEFWGLFSLPASHAFRAYPP